MNEQATARFTRTMTSLSDDLSDVARSVHQITEFIKQCHARDLTAEDCAALRGLIYELEAFVRARPALRTPRSELDND